MKSEEPIEEVSKVFEIDTSDWNTYSNEKYSFELRYPKGWTVVENAGVPFKLRPSVITLISPKWKEHRSHLQGGEISICVYDDIKQFISHSGFAVRGENLIACLHSSPKVIGFKPIRSGKFPVVKAWIRYFGVVIYEVFFAADNKLYEIIVDRILEHDEQDRAIVKRIISTFRLCS